tara:strand:- start:309 stop:542 length:234 start_codon:yes stop_codon:yes gene_type:complete
VDQVEFQVFQQSLQPEVVAVAEQIIQLEPLLEDQVVEQEVVLLVERQEMILQQFLLKECQVGQQLLLLVEEEEAEPL